jgi:hypothetical protein
VNVPSIMRRTRSDCSRAGGYRPRDGAGPRHACGVLHEQGRAIMSDGTLRWLDARRRHPAVVDFAHCVRVWGGLVARRQLGSPKEYVGTHLHFRDGTTSLVFRETLRRAPTLEATLLVIQFRLAALGSNRWAHAAFAASVFCTRRCSPASRGFARSSGPTTSPPASTAASTSGTAQRQPARTRPGWWACSLPSQTPTRHAFKWSQVFAATRSCAIHMLHMPTEQTAGGESNSQSSRPLRSIRRMNLSSPWARGRAIFAFRTAP